MTASGSQTATNAARARNQANLLRQVRQLHSYLGTFFAPAIIFFSFSGALQLFGLHEERPGSSYRPPAWVEKLGQVHKHQILTAPPKRPRPVTGATERPEKQRAAAPGGPPRDSLATQAVQWFFLFMSVGLIVTTLLGIYMSFKYNRDRRIIWGLLLTGTALPIALLVL